MYARPVPCIMSLHYVREHVRYVKDIASVERFATPQSTLFMEKAGDCDDSSIALCTLLERIGHETRLIERGS
jgi:transglutaminase-like putative cysteine protease